MLSITNKVDSLISHCVCFVCDTNYVFPTMAPRMAWDTKVLSFSSKVIIVRAQCRWRCECD